MKSILKDVERVSRNVEGVVVTTEKIIAPVRESVFKRFPTLSLVFVTFGVSATAYGIERGIASIAWLNDRPVLIITSGIIALVITGRLYKKLG